MIVSVFLCNTTFKYIILIRCCEMVFILCQHHLSTFRCDIPETSLRSSWGNIRIRIILYITVNHKHPCRLTIGVPQYRITEVFPQSFSTSFFIRVRPTDRYPLIRVHRRNLDRIIPPSLIKECFYTSII